MYVQSLTLGICFYIYISPHTQIRSEFYIKPGFSGDHKCRPPPRPNSPFWFDQAWSSNKENVNTHLHVYFCLIFFMKTHALFPEETAIKLKNKIKVIHREWTFQWGRGRLIYGKQGTVFAYLKGPYVKIGSNLHVCITFLLAICEWEVKMRPFPCLLVAYTSLWMICLSSLMLLDCGFIDSGFRFSATVQMMRLYAHSRVPRLCSANREQHQQTFSLEVESTNVNYPRKLILKIVDLK